MSVADYGLYFALTLALSTVFAMGGVGSAVALVPVLHLTGLPLNLAKALGLFVNSASTITASVMNLRRGVLDFRFALPLVLSVLVTTPLGAWSSQFVAETAVQWALAAFMVVSAALMVFSRREAKVAFRKPWVLPLLGGAVGYLSGLIGVGGGVPILAVLTLLGYDAKKAAYAVSFVIPFSTMGGFATYLSFVEMDWPLLAVVGGAAIIGGYVGGRIMHFRLSADQVKKLIAVLLLALAGQIVFRLLS